MAVVVEAAVTTVVMRAVDGKLSQLCRHILVASVLS